MKVLSVAKSFSDQPEEKVITISRIKDSSCPYRYFKGYVEKPKDKKAFVSIEAGIGQYFHKYVENRFKHIKNGTGTISPNDALDIPDLIRSFRLSFLWEGKLRKPYKIVRSTYDLDDFVLRLKIIAKNFNEFLSDNLIGQKVIGTEGALQIRTDSFCVRGKYDLITQTPSGAFKLWDWKSGKIPDPAFYEDFLNQKIQLGIYAVWMKHQFKTTNVRGTAVFLRDDIQDLSEKFTTKVEQEVIHYLYDWRSKLNNLSSFPPIPNKLCDWCGWNPTCPAYTNDEVIQHKELHKEKTSNVLWWIIGAIIVLYFLLRGCFF